MAMILQVLIAMVAGWLQHHQQQVIADLLADNRVLKAQLGGRRLRLTDTERRRLAMLAHPRWPYTPERGRSDRYPRDPPALVPVSDRAEVRREQAASPVWPTPYRRGGGAAHGAHGRGEPDLGLPAPPRGVGKSWAPH